MCLADAMAIDVLPCLHAAHQLQVTVLRALKLRALHHFSFAASFNQTIAASFNAQSTDQVVYALAIDVLPAALRFIQLQVSALCIEACCNAS